jgi:diguanylate cyclase
MTKLAILAFAWILTGLPVLAWGETGPVEWSASDKRKQFSSFVDYMPAPQRGMSITEVMRAPDEAWTRNDAENVSLGYGDTVYWFRFTLVTDAAEAVPYLLEVSYSVLDYLDVYLVEDGQVKKTWQMGDKLPFHERPIFHRNFVVPSELGPEASQTMYLRVDTTSSMQVPMTLWNPDAFYAAEQARSMLEGMYYGIVLVMILYNLFLFLAVGERHFLSYVGYISAMPLFLAGLHGVSYQYLWPEAIWWNDRSHIVFLNLVVVFGGIFTVSFINVTRDKHPWLNLATRVIVGISGLLAVAGLLAPFRYLILPSIVVAITGCILVLVVCVVRWVHKDPAARFYTLSWVAMLFGGIVLALSKFTVLPRNVITENATQVGSALGVILLSVALADRLNREKKRAIEAQQLMLGEERKARMAQEKSLQIQREANTLLEARVQERTRDLESLNEQLRELSATDSLTGLKNRGYFDRSFQSACVKAFRFGQPLSVLVLDIDHFKRFNDTYGHLVGDDCLQMVSRCIRLYVTRPQDLAARYGGEEFVVLLPDTPEEGAMRVAEKIREEIASTEFRVADEVLHLTISIGVYTVVPERADDTGEIFKRADTALYEAKEQGRNRVVAYRTSAGDVL